MSDLLAVPSETDVDSGQTTESPADRARVEDALRAVSAALRSHRLYAGEGPMLDRFLDTARARVAALWETLPLLRLEIDEQSVQWEGVRVYPVGDSGSELAFLFYKDGIREITLLPGVEGEIAKLLDVLARAPQARAEEDDLITLLWQEDFAAFQYQFVEPAGEGVELGRHDADAPRQPVDPAEVRSDAATPTRGFRPEDFREALYFLDDAELQLLADEVRKEAERDLWQGVLTAVYDRLEDGQPERQERILRILAELLPSLLGAGEFRRAAELLRELAELAARPGVLAAATLREVRELFGQLASPTTVEQLVRMVEADPEILRDDSLVTLFHYLPPEALAPLARASATIGRPDVRRAFETVVERLAGGNRDEVVRLLGDSDPLMVAGALRWVRELAIGSAATTVTELLDHPEAAIRAAALEALVALGASTSAPAMERLLDDPEREVRIGAARSLAALGYSAARAALEQALLSKRLRAADRSEKIAFFEAYGQVGGAEAVPLLDKTLNARSWLGRGETAEIRACAALGLARVRHPSARSALGAAASDSDPVVRSAVARALRGEEGA